MATRSNDQHGAAAIAPDVAAGVRVCVEKQSGGALPVSLPDHATPRRRRRRGAAAYGRGSRPSGPHRACFDTFGNGRDCEVRPRTPYAAPLQNTFASHAPRTWERARSRLDQSCHLCCRVAHSRGAQALLGRWNGMIGVPHLRACASFGVSTPYPAGAVRGSDAPAPRQSTPGSLVTGRTSRWARPRRFGLRDSGRPARKRPSARSPELRQARVVGHVSVFYQLG
jgi:hypothetical protein